MLFFGSGLCWFFQEGHLVTQPGSAPKARPPQLTMADVVHKVAPKDSPLRAGFFKGCGP